MRIVYDGEMLRWQRIGGIARYFGEIISRLPTDWVPVVLGLDKPKHPIVEHPNIRIATVQSVRPRSVRKVWWKLRHIRQANVLHPTYYNLSDGLRYKDFQCPVIITVYDLIYAQYPQLMEDAEKWLGCFCEAITRADHVVCISKATESDLLDLYPEVAGKTSVVYLGSSLSSNSEPQSPGIFERPTFVFVGGRVGYKNYDLLLRAFAKACQSHSRIRLHLAGAPLTLNESWQIYYLGISDRIDCSPFPDDDTLRELYRKSVALLYPSRHEGFGIPALEAMACGTIAVTANTTSLPEVVGDGGIMLDPADESAWTECILQLARGDSDRARVLERGRKRVSQFSWDRTAEQHVEIYKRLGSS